MSASQSVPDSSPIHLPVRVPENVCTALSGPYRGTHVLPSPDPGLPYTLDGNVWSMELIKTLDAGWGTVGELLSKIKEDMLNLADVYILLERSLLKYGQRAPVYVDSTGTRLLDGLHRIAIADNLGWLTMLVSTDRIRWHEWDQSQEGQEYYSSWRYKIGLVR